MKTSIKAIAGAALASIAMAAGAGVANAEPVGGTVSLTFNFNNFEFRGKVDGDKGVCTRNRQVRVYEKQEGNDSLVGGDKTDSGGKFRISPGGSVNGGTKHYAVAQKKTVDGVKCAEIKSKSITPNDFEN